MTRRLTLITGTLAFVLPALAVARADATGPAPVAAPAKVAETAAALRVLWTDHIFWVRDVVNARLAGDETRAKAAEQQVVANAKALAGSIEPFYDKAASEKLFELLAGHWGAISRYLDATRKGDAAGQKSATDSLTGNADQIAAFLSGANPNLPRDTLRGLLVTHGAHHVQQIQQLHAKQYEQEAKTWAAMRNHVNGIADALASAIAKQFPEKFQ